MITRYEKVGVDYVAVDEQEAVVGILKLLPLQSYYQELKPLRTANESLKKVAPNELILAIENAKLQREIEELKKNLPMTAMQHLSRLKSQADTIRKVYYEVCNITK